MVWQPYICAEVDMGGLPSWLLRDPHMRVRSSNAGFLAAVRQYWAWLLPLVVPLQQSLGGPIIAVQVAASPLPHPPHSQRARRLRQRRHVGPQLLHVLLRQLNARISAQSGLRSVPARCTHPKRRMLPTRWRTSLASGATTRRTWRR
jgi:hypothetical protein